MATGDVRAMGQSLKYLLTKESVDAFADMSKKEARYLTRAVESLSKETGDYVSDHLFATLRSQFEKGTSRAKAVKFAKNLFHKRQAVDRMYDYLDDAARAALYELAEAEDVLQEEIEQLGKIAQTYQAEAGKTLTKTQLDDLLGDSTLGEKSVEEVVAGLVAADKYFWKDGYQSDIRYLGTGKVGDFSDIGGKSIEEILAGIPSNAVRRELTPEPGKVTEGFEYKWIDNGKTYRVRIHGADASAPAGSKAANGWVVRVQQGKKYLDPITKEYQPQGISNINSPYYNEEIANRTHIPIKEP